jgi:hypothetical protein
LMIIAGEQRYLSRDGGCDIRSSTGIYSWHYAYLRWRLHLRNVHSDCCGCGKIQGVDQTLSYSTRHTPSGFALSRRCPRHHTLPRCQRIETRSQGLLQFRCTPAIANGKGLARGCHAVAPHCFDLRYSSFARPF